MKRAVRNWSRSMAKHRERTALNQEDIVTDSIKQIAQDATTRAFTAGYDGAAKFVGTLAAHPRLLAMSTADALKEVVRLLAECSPEAQARRHAMRSLDSQRFDADGNAHEYDAGGRPVR